MFLGLFYVKKMSWFTFKSHRTTALKRQSYIILVDVCRHLELWKPCLIACAFIQMVSNISTSQPKTWSPVVVCAVSDAMEDSQALRGTTGLRKEL